MKYSFSYIRLRLIGITPKVYEYCLILFISVLTSFFIVILPKQDVLGWVTIVVGLFILLLFIIVTPKLRYILILAFLFRISLVLFQTYISPLSLNISDAIMFEAFGWEYAKNGIDWILSHFTTGAFFYSWIIGLLYSITDRSPFMIEALNALFGTLTVWNVYHITRKVWTEEMARKSSMLVALFPSLILFSSVILREVPIIYSYTLGLLFFLRWEETKRLKWILSSIIMILLSVGFHTGMLGFMIVLGFIMLKDWLKTFIKKRYYIPLKTSASLIFIILIFVIFILRFGWGLEKVGGSLENISAEFLSYQQQIAARDRARYLSELVIKTPIDFLWQTPIRVFYFLFSPFIWMIKTPSDLLGFIDAILYIYLSYKLFISFSSVLSSRRGKILLIFFISEIIIFSLTTSNYGTALRHRAKFFPLLVVLAYNRMEENNKEEENNVKNP